MVEATKFDAVSMSIGLKYGDLCVWRGVGQRDHVILRVSSAGGADEGPVISRVLEIAEVLGVVPEVMRYLEERAVVAAESLAGQLRRAEQEVGAVGKSRERLAVVEAARDAFVVQAEVVDE